MKNAAYIHPWRNWITQQIPILENGGSNPFGWAKKIKDTIVVVSFTSLLLYCVPAAKQQAVWILKICNSIKYLWALPYLQPFAMLPQHCKFTFKIVKF